ncbi:zinc transport system substrate-binding protein [Methanolobus vulcani]|jgi:zinc transport system substrate-binding protein|uniref:Zinc transport system substrate-binding protein n=1 Tax=Methanolobus vulcani TaxID=38026 RepID=A0A7Z7AYE7_9EURY|nr:zinc ABC transporter substrate-binding protein [Methanolobus vulcani]MDK2826013.1 zinc transport system substrate-binding protein [Methanolobus sp.]SDF54968.1 zinc transport system substrate-binding protein [Methanolobus vulcani]
MKKISTLLTAFILMGVVLTAGCVDEQSSSDNGSNNIIVGVTILPQQEFVEKIAGDNVQVVVMVPPGADPHSYEPTPSQLTALSKAKMYAMVGSGITVEDNMMGKLTALNPDMLVVDCSKGISLIEMEAHDHGDEVHGAEAQINGSADTNTSESAVYQTTSVSDHANLDPHIWTSPDNVEVMVENIYQGLIQIDPDNQATYLENKNAYLAELNALDKQIQTSLEGKEGSSFMVYHPAWGYFANHYGLNEVSVEIEGKEPSVKDMQSVIDLANEKGIKVIFVQSGFSTVSAEAIASEIGGEVVEVDPLAKDYIDNLAKVAKAFEKGLA